MSKRPREKKEQKQEPGDDEKELKFIYLKEWDWEAGLAKVRAKRKQRRVEQTAKEAAKRDQEKFETPWAPDPSFPDVKRQPSVSKQPENDQDFRDDEDFQDKNSNDPFHTGDLRAALPTQPGVEEGGVQNLDEKPAHHHKPTSRRSDTRYGNDTVPRSGKSSSAAGGHRHQGKDEDRATKERPGKDRTSEKKRRHG